MSKAASFISEFEGLRRQEKNHLKAHRLGAYLAGRELARRLFQTMARYQEALETEDRDIGRQEHRLDEEFAHGFTEAFMGTLKGVPGLISPEDREELATCIAEDIRDHAEQALADMGEEWVSPWLLYADKLSGADRLLFCSLTIGLYRRDDVMSCATILSNLEDDQARQVAVSMLESYSRHGMNDPAFVNVATQLLNDMGKP